MREAGQIPLLGERRRRPGPGRLAALGGANQTSTELGGALNRGLGDPKLAQRQQGEDAAGAASDQVVLERPRLVVEPADDLPRALAQARLAQDRARARGTEGDAQLPGVSAQP